MPAIFVNSMDSRPRQRWTLAHELAHHMLDLTNPAPVITALLTDARDDRWETMCDHWAAELLMPGPTVRKLARFRTKPDRLANLFQVSQPAIRRRLHNLRNIAT
jgi:Zn-dependent peptidase ImmA (M78 family)